MPSEGEPNEQILRTCLTFAVPMWIDVVRDMTPEERVARSHELSRIVCFGERHDELRGQHGEGPALFCVGESPKGKNKGSVSAVFNGLAEGLAILSYQPGGVTWMGLHWETPNPKDEGPKDEGPTPPAKEA